MLPEDLMFRKINITALSTLIFILGSSSFAQTAPVSGQVLLKKSDGTTVPLVGARVHPLEMGIKASAPADKTDKKGNFNFAGLKVGASYILSISGPGAAPSYVPDVKPGRSDNLVVTLDEGDGSTLPEAEVRAAVARGSRPAIGAGAAPSGELTAEQKKAQAEAEAKLKEVQARNANTENANKVTVRALEEGNAAYTSKNYDLAIAKYDEGIAVAPDFAGSAPVLLSNRGIALRDRAVSKFQPISKITDVTAKLEARKAVTKDFSDSITSFERALTVLKAAAPGDIDDPKVAESRKMDALRGLKDTFLLMIRTELVDPEKASVAKTYIPEYISLETDAAEKAKAVLIVADIYRVAGDSENAVTEYRKVLAASPDNIDAMAGLGLSLINVGYLKEDKALMQEGSNYLQKFATAAPDTHKLKQDAIATIENLKKEQNVTPVKAAGGGRKKS